MLLKGPMWLQAWLVPGPNQCYPRPFSLHLWPLPPLYCFHYQALFIFMVTKGLQAAQAYILRGQIEK